MFPFFQKKCLLINSFFAKSLTLVCIKHFLSFNCVSVLQGQRDLQLHGCLVHSNLWFSSALNIYLNRSKQPLILENFCVLEFIGVGKSVEIAIVSSNQNDISDENKYLLIKNRASKKKKKKKKEKLKTHKDKRNKSGENNPHCEQSTDGLFCAASVLLPMLAHRDSRANSLITQSYCNWKHIK